MTISNDFLTFQQKQRGERILSAVDTLAAIFGKSADELMTDKYRAARNAQKSTLRYLDEHAPTYN